MALRFGPSIATALSKGCVTWRASIPPSTKTRVQRSLDPQYVCTRLADALQGQFDLKSSGKISIHSSLVLVPRLADMLPQRGLRGEGPQIGSVGTSAPSESAGECCSWCASFWIRPHASRRHHLNELSPEADQVRVLSSAAFSNAHGTFCMNVVGPSS